MPNTDNRITFRQAFDFVKNLLTQQECNTLPPVANQNAIGATITIDGFNGITDKAFHTLTFRGNLAWLCWSNDSTFPKFFLAFETQNNFDPAVLVQSPQQLDLAYTESIFKFIGNASDPVIETLLLIGPASPNIPNDALPISSSKVNNFTQNFLLNFPKDPHGDLYNEFAYGFFEDGTDNDIKEFLEQKDAEGNIIVKYVRYYFGYSSVEKPNRLRIILFAVDAAGNNISKSRSGATNPNGTPADAIILQKSWPPGGF